MTSFDQETHRLRVVHSITEFEQATWDALVSPVVQASYGWLKTIEETTTYSVRFLYFLLETETFLEGVAMAYIPNHGLSPSLDNHLFGRMKGLCSVFGVSFTPSLICGALRCDGAHVFVSRHLAEIDRRRVFHKIIDGMERYARDLGLSNSFLDVLATEKELLQVLREREYNQTSLPPKTLLKVCWPTFEGYLKHLRELSFKSYKTARREINRNRAAGVVVRELSRLNESGSVLFELLQSHYMRKNHIPFPHTPQFIDTLKRNLGDNLVIYTAVKNECPVGIELLLKMETVGWLPFVGIDYTRTPGEFTYFTLGYYTPIEDAIRRGLKSLLCGGAPHEVKMRRGFRLVNSFLLYRPAVWPGTWIGPIWFAIHRYWQRRKYKSLFALDTRYFGSDHSDQGRQKES